MPKKQTLYRIKLHVAVLLILLPFPAFSYELCLVNLDLVNNQVFIESRSNTESQNINAYIDRQELKVNGISSTELIADIGKSSLSDGKHQLRISMDGIEQNWSFDTSPTKFGERKNFIFINNCHGDQILFTSDRDGNHEVYIINEDGSGLQNLSRNLGVDYDASFNSASNQIVFTSARTGFRDVYIMDALGNGQTRISDYDNSDDFSPVFSPDGSKVAYVSDRGGNHEIFLMNSDGSDQINISNSIAADGNPSFSPDGMTLSFSSNRDGNWEVYTVDIASLIQTRLTIHYKYNAPFGFNPDGSKILYREGGQDSKLFIMNADGSDKLNLSLAGSTEAINASFSPDGNRIVFADFISGNSSFQVFTVGIDGLADMQVTYSAEGVRKPVYNPSGTRIAYVVRQNLYVVNVDGSNPQYVTNVVVNEGGVRGLIRYRP